MLKALLTTLLAAALGLLGYDASLGTRAIRERRAVTTPMAEAGDMHTMDGGDGFPPPPRP
jgi:hypothetical protein